MQIPCPQCGHHNEAAANACAECGFGFAAVKPSNEQLYKYIHYFIMAVSAAAIIWSFVTD